MDDDDGAPVTIACGGTEATFLPALGMLGVSLRVDGVEYIDMHGGTAAWRSRHTTGIPLLYPWANRLGGRGYEVEGVAVDLDGLDVPVDGNDRPMHGLLLGAHQWQLRTIDERPERSRLVAAFDFSDPVLLAAFPFPHLIEVEAAVEARGRLTMTVRVLAGPDRDVPVSFGWHPYFALPGVARSELSLDLPDRRLLQLDEWQIPTGHSESQRAGTVPLEGREFDDGYELTGDRVIVLHGGGHQVRVEFGGYVWAQVYAPRDRSFVAIEPMTAPADALRSGSFEAVPAGGSYDVSFIVVAGTA